MSGKKIIIFTGLSISHEEAFSILEANYRPPIKRNDILKIIEEKPDIVGIIDGVFHQSPAVGHKEIIKAMDKGIKIVGGSSMGALRASELESLGMIGIGYIYNQYTQGKIESDDDVAIVFNPENNEPLSEALVNVTYNFKKATKKGIITKDEELELLKIAKSIYYPKRTYYKILNKSNINDETKEALNNFISTLIDIKKQDAIAVLEYIKKLK